MEADTIKLADTGSLPATTGSLSGREPSSVSTTAVDRENLDRLLRIFNAGNGLSMGEKVVRAIETQACVDSSNINWYEIECADIIRASICGSKLRKHPDTILRLEEGKRRVTINDTRGPARPAPLGTQRVKTFYMDDYMGVGSKRDTVLIPNLGTKSARARSMIGGTPITRETAIELRNITLGSTVHSFSSDWRKSGCIFQDVSSKYPYGLQTSKNSTRAFVLGLQGYVLKHLLFAREYSSSLGTKNAITPTEFERRRALCSAICDVLWQAGNRIRCCVALMAEEPMFDTDYRYRVDGITEKLNLYEFKKYQDLEIFVKRHLSHFEHINSNGSILLLYSLILSRTITNIQEDLAVTEKDLEPVKLLTDNEGCTPALLNLLLTGRAVRHYHNGNLIYDNDGKVLPYPLRGIKERSHVGLLFWDKGEDPDYRTEIGSMLKTPKYPIWLTLVNGQFGLLFSINPDLVSDWRVEHHFILHYYTGLSSCPGTQLTVETLRVPKDPPATSKPKMFSTLYTRYTRRQRCKTGLQRKMEEDRTPPLEQAILTKWYGANIDWHGVFPFI